MTAEQFNKICAYVYSRLENEESFKIPVEEFVEMFDLTPPFYSDFIERLCSLAPRFSCDGPWKDASGDPCDPIRFERQ